jgi:hypothetical protein
VAQDVSYLATLLIGAILSFVGLTAFLPVEIFRKIFGYVWPMGSSESRDRALERRFVAAMITAVGIIALRAGIAALSGHLR